MAKAKTLLTVQAFQATPSMLPPYLAPKIAPIDHGFPLRIPDDISEEPLPTPTPEFLIDENMKQVLSALNKDKGGKAHHGKPPSLLFRTSTKA